MFDIKSNINIVIANELQRLKALANADIVLRQAAFDSVALITNRVQQDGQNAAEQRMDDYSPAYAKQRRKKGRQISNRDLTFTGDLMRNFVVQGSGTGYVVGFSSKIESDKAQYNEASQGSIFMLSNDEKAFIEAEILRKITQILAS